MKYLLDVNVLLAAIIENHPDHAVVDSWLPGKQLAVCPLSELGFLRISTHPKAYHFGMPIARQALEDFLLRNQVEFISADLPTLKTAAARSEEVTDSYLAELAAQHKARLATLDTRLKHAAVELVK